MLWTAEAKRPINYFLTNSTRPCSRTQICSKIYIGGWVWSWPSASRARARCPCPRTWMVAGPARPPTLPKDAAAAATSRVLPALRLPLPWFPTEYAAQLLPVSHDAAPHCCTAYCPDGPSLYIFLASVHLGLVLRSASLSLSTQDQWSRMLLFANHHLTLSVGICWNSGTELEPAHGEES